MIELNVQFVEKHIQKEDTKGSLSSWVHLLLRYDFTRICPRSVFLMHKTTIKEIYLGKQYEGNCCRHFAKQDQNSKIILEK